MPAWSFRAGAAFGFALCVTFLACVAVEPFGAFGSVVLDDVSTAVVPICAGLLCLLRDRRRPAGAGRGWLLLGISCLLWGAGGLAWVLDEVVLRRDVPTPSLPDVGYLASVPFAVLAMIRINGSNSVLSGVRNLFDAALAAGALLFVSWATVLGPAFQSASGPLATRAALLAYPLSDVVTTSIALLSMAQPRGETRTTMGLVGSGLAAVAVSDSVFAWVVNHGEIGGNYFDTGYLAGFVLIGLATLRSSHTGPRAAAGASGSLGTLLPYLPLVAAGAVTVTMHVRHAPSGPFLFWNGMVLVALVLARQLLSLFANRALSRQLQASLDAVRERETQLRHQAFHDSLTGLPNRALFAEQVEVARHELGTWTLIAMLLDLDGFKLVNDTLGHHAGDRLLVIVADRLRLAVRQDDLVCRLGGDEFAVLLVRGTTLAEARALATRILAALRAPAGVEGTTVRVGASLGLVEAEQSDGFETIMRRADLAMYEAKRSGRDTFVVHPTPSP